MKKERNICKFLKVLGRLYSVAQKCIGQYIQIRKNSPILELWFLQIVLLFTYNISLTYPLSVDILVPNRLNFFYFYFLQQMLCLNYQHYSMTSVQYVYAYLQYTVINIHWPLVHTIFPILGIEIPKAGVFQSVQNCLPTICEYRHMLK